MSTVLVISFLESARSIGIAKQTAKNWYTAGKFPIPTFLIGRRRMVRVSDLDAFVAGLGGGNSRQPAIDQVVSTVVPQKRPRGRPRKTHAATAKSQIQNWEFGGSSCHGSAHKSESQQQLIDGRHYA